MKQINIHSHKDHHELFQVLPWYVNKTLQGSELKAVEEHLAVCLVCKREVMQLQKLAQAVIHSGSIDSAEQASFSRLKKRLHTSVESVHNPELALGNKHNAENIRLFNRASKKQASKMKVFWQPALAMAAAVILSLTVMMPHYTSNDMQFKSNFKTLSSDKNMDAIKASEIRVVFADNVDQQQKRQIIEGVHGQFIGDKPTAQGVYTVKLEKDIAPEQMIDVLRKDKNVIFAEPAYALLSSTHEER